MCNNRYLWIPVHVIMYVMLFLRLLILMYVKVCVMKMYVFMNTDVQKLDIRIMCNNMNCDFIVNDFNVYVCT